MGVDTKAPNEPATQHILLDTCILQYLSNKQLGEQLIPYLVALQERKFILAISEISIYELLSGSTIKQEQEGLAVLNLFKVYQIIQNVLIAASQLSTLYHCEEGLPDNAISPQDKFIAATSVLTGSLILTANVSDFPRPFFQEVEEKLIFYRKKDKTRMQVVQILRPNNVFIQTRFTDRPK